MTMILRFFYLVSFFCPHYYFYSSSILFGCLLFLYRMGKVMGFGYTSHSSSVLYIGLLYKVEFQCSCFAIDFGD